MKPLWHCHGSAFVLRFSDSIRRFAQEQHEDAAKPALIKRKPGLRQGRRRKRRHHGRKRLSQKPRRTSRKLDPLQCTRSSTRPPAHPEQPMARPVLRLRASRSSAPAITSASYARATSAGADGLAIAPCRKLAIPHRTWQQRGGYHGYRIPEDALPCLLWTSARVPHL